jgi:hypothetical protein
MKMKRGEQDLLIRMITGLDFLYDTINHTYYTEADYVWIKSRLYPYDKSGRVKKDYESLIKLGWLKQVGDKLSVYVGVEDELQRFDEGNDNQATPEPVKKSAATKPPTPSNGNRQPLQTESANPINGENYNPSSPHESQKNTPHESAKHKKNPLHSRIYISSTRNNTSASNNILESSENENAQRKKSGRLSAKKSAEVLENKDATVLTETLISRIKEYNVRAQLPDKESVRYIEKWLYEAHLMLVNQKIPKDEILEVIDWLFSGEDNDSSFWQDNIQSMSKLRKQYSVLFQKMNKNRKGNNYGKNKTESWERDDDKFEGQMEGLNTI